MHRLALRVIRIAFAVTCLASGGCVVASGTNESLDDAELSGAEAETVDSSTEALSQPSFLTNYYWNSAYDKGLTKTMISDQEGFCALTNIGGRFKTTADFVGVWQSGGHFTLSGTTNQTGEAVHASARCVPISQFSTHGWAFSGVFYTGWTSNGTTNTWGVSMDLTGWDRAQSRCWVNGVGGDFTRGGEVSIDSAGSFAPNWHLGLSGVGYKGQSLVGRASCVKFVASSALANTTVTGFWTQSNGTGPSNRNVKLAKASTHFCFLNDVGMGTTQWNDSAYITFSSTDGYYYLTGSWSGGNARIFARATCVAYNQL